ncbi:hypothetical protein [Pseudomonas zhanjiangensis]|uniref:TIGR02285 family protein n=1 Tax=Pseudomonas zhanjiangensis TaxID=3239015 RepID=A0ABV3YTG2_9PSED
MNRARIAHAAALVVSLVADHSRRTCRVSGLLAMLLVTGVQAESLTWGLLPIPGGVLLKEGEPHSGILLESLQLLEPDLPGLDIHYELFNVPRLQQALAAGRELCSNGSLPLAERDRLGYFVPYLMSPPMELVVRADTVARLPWRGERLYLSDLLASEQLRGGLARRRTYPEAVRAALAKAQDAGNLERFGGGIAGGGENLLFMVSHGRIDFTLEYPPVVMAINRDELILEPLRSIGLADNTELQLSGIYCTRSAWGLAMARRLDRAVRRQMAEPRALLALYQRYLPAETFATYRTPLLDYFRRRHEETHAPVP